MDKKSSGNFQALTGFAKHLAVSNLLAETAVQEIFEKAHLEQRSLISVLLENNFLDAKKLAITISQYFDFPYADLAHCSVASLPYDLLDESLILKYRVLPLSKNGDQLTLAIADPTDMLVIDEIKFHTQLSIKPAVAESEKLNELIAELTHIRRCNLLEQVGAESEENRLADAPVVKFIDDMFCSAIEKNASDVHFEPYEKFYRIRFRIDGLLHEITRTDLIFARRFSARLKIMARLDIAEKRLPQDGRFTLHVCNKQTRDCRASFCPTQFGEKIVVRILNPGNVNFNVGELGLETEQQKLFIHYINRTESMVLVTGPTGSGKTVSLYTALNILNTETKNISTVEDPVEINLSGINQVEVNNKIGLGFAEVLRTFLRQDPDIIMVGEIRDLDTAQIAIKAAQTGHLVLATLHTNTAAEAITRLLNMGVAAFNLANSVGLIIAQRLVRKLCPHCKKPSSLPAEVLSEEGFSGDQIEKLVIYMPQGCDKCHKGYRGRIGIFEMLPFSSNFGKILLDRGNAFAIAEQAKLDGIQSLRSAALNKVAQGVTSLEEINRIII